MHRLSPVHPVVSRSQTSQALCTRGKSGINLTCGMNDHKEKVFHVFLLCSWGRFSVYQ